MKVYGNPVETAARFKKLIHSRQQKREYLSAREISPENALAEGWVLPGSIGDREAGYFSYAGNIVVTNHYKSFRLGNGYVPLATLTARPSSITDMA
ncbi:hypothetical protein GCM10027318_39610 [Massilia agilis]